MNECTEHDPSSPQASLIDGLAFTASSCCISGAVLHLLSLSWGSWRCSRARVQRNEAVPSYRRANAPRLDRKLLCFLKSSHQKSESWISLGRICAFLFLRRRFEFRGFPDGLNRLMPLLETVPSRNLKIHLAQLGGTGVRADAKQRDPAHGWM